MAYKFYKIFLALLFFTITGFIFFPHTAKSDNQLPIINVYVSSDNLMQADTLLVVVKNETSKITGKLGTVKMHFLRNEDNKDWVSVVGMPVNKKPGNYKLLISVLGKQPFEKNVQISKRNFPITELVITKELLKKGYTAKKIIKNIEKVENKQLNKILNILTPVAYFTKPFINPLSEINVVGDFGDIRQTKSYKIQHLGVDLKAPLNTPVYAVNDGKVVFIKSLPDYGNTIIIDHGLGIYSLYLHLSEFKVKKGKIVKQQDIIGLSGDTGYAIGPHLHFSIKVRGAALDPLGFIKTTQTDW